MRARIGCSVPETGPVHAGSFVALVIRDWPAETSAMIRESPFGRLDM